MRLKNDVNIDSIKTIVERYPESNDILSILKPFVILLI